MTTQFLRPTVLVVAALSSGVFGLTPAAAQQTLYVDADAPVGGDGTSWSTALNTLQGALDIAAVNGMVEAIRIAEGTYRPSHETVPGDARSATFQLLNGVAFYGGYPGFDAADPDLRDVDTHMTILSGDLNDDDATVGRDENAYHVLTGAGADSTAIVDGFTITAGNADATDPDDIGGGMYNSNGSPTLVQCTFSKNFATYGAGMFNLDNSSPTLVQCAFRFNIASFSGGGMYNQIDSSPAMIDCEFTDNVADPASSGGGLLNHQNCNAWLTRCIFLNNSAAAGGGILNVQSSPRLTASTQI